MTKAQLIEALEDCSDFTEIRFMAQNRFMAQDMCPFEYSIMGTWASNNEADFTPHDDRCDKEAEQLEVVYLVEGTQLGYGSKVAFEDCDRC